MPARGIPLTPGTPSDPTPTTPGSVVPGGNFTAYNPAPGTDPEWDAFLAMYQARITNANAEAEKAKKQLQTEYDAGLGRLNLAQPGVRANAEASLLSRGVGRSSEAQSRRADIEAAYVDQQAAANRALTEGKSGVDSGLTSSLLDLAAERERQIAASRARLGTKAPTADTPGYDDPTKPKSGSKSGGNKGGSGKNGGGNGGSGTAIPPVPTPTPITKRPGLKVI